MIEQDAPAAAVTVAGDILCRTCGYNLRSLSPESLCPECGTRVEFSLRGNLLRFSDPQWLRHVALGLAMQFFGLVTATISTIVYFSKMGRRGPRTFLLSPTVVGSGFRALPNRTPITVIESISVIVIAAGAWMATAREPAEDAASDTSSLRTMIRIGCTVFAIETLFQLVSMLTVLSPPWYFALSIAGFFADLINLSGIVAQLIWMSELAKRVPRKRSYFRHAAVFLISYIGWKTTYTFRWQLGMRLSSHTMSRLSSMITMFGSVYSACWVSYVIQLAVIAVLIESQFAMARSYRRSVTKEPGPI
jgi:hypothetical protein